MGSKEVFNNSGPLDLRSAAAPALPAPPPLRETEGSSIQASLPKIAPDSIEEVLLDLEKSSPFYNWKILSKSIAGQERQVVLFGEAHRTGAAGSEAAERVLRHFKYQAREGIDPRKYWLPKVMRARLQDFRLLQETFPEMYDHDGAIAKARQTQAVKEEAVARLLDDIVLQLQSSDADLVIESDRYDLSTAEIRDVISAVLDSAQKRAASATAPQQDLDCKLERVLPVVGYDLEENHKPDSLEKLSAAFQDLEYIYSERHRISKGPCAEVSPP